MGGAIELSLGAMRPKPSFSRVLATVSLIFALGACLGQTPAAKMQETARDMNMNARFGRMELVVENVAPKYRAEFVQRHRAWGQHVRVADTELVGIHFGEKEAESMVAVAWYEVTRQELRGTTVRQKWKSHRGDWLLESEERADGDPGLFGEAVPQPEPKPHETSQFRTITIK